MYIEGRIKTYQIDRGFGFIQIEGNRKDVFFHIRDMPQPHITPAVGEPLKFMIVEDQGKLRADRIHRVDLSASNPKNTINFSNAATPVRHTPQSRAQEREAHLQQRQRKQQQQKSSGFPLLKWILVIVLVCGAYSLFRPMLMNAYHRYQLSQQPATPMQTAYTTEPATSANTTFQCDGRTHCSEMTSYEEAVYFINHCPGTKMDGNHDGRPCERQFGR